MLGVHGLLLIAVACSGSADQQQNTQPVQGWPGAGAGVPAPAMPPAGETGAAAGMGAAAGGTSGGAAASGGSASPATAGVDGAGTNAGAAGSEPAPAPDGDEDGVPDADDNCVEADNPDQDETDGDGVGDACDNCPEAPNADQRDADADGTGDVCACGNPVVACEHGAAGPYPCSGIDLLAHLSLTDLNARAGNDVWGFHDPVSGRELAVVGLDDGTAFVDLTNPHCPDLLGKLGTATTRSLTRDVKVHGHHALSVSEARDHGMQIFDLRELDDAPQSSALSATMVYRGTRAAVVGNAHNIAVNERSGFVYIVGAGSCGGGLHMVDFTDPARPTFAGCGSDAGYVHDAQCLTYEGPDADHSGREICFTFNGDDSFSVVDVSDKSAPRRLSTEAYDGGEYSHQGWLTEDGAFLILTDELDEDRNGHPTRTYLFDVSDLDAPRFVGAHTAQTAAIDHNVHVRDGLAYLASYTAGVRVLDLENVATGELDEVAYFDTVPETDAAQLGGAWTAFPYFPSRTLVVNGTRGGLFLLRANASVVPPSEAD